MRGILHPSKAKKNNKSGHTGVFWDAREKKWTASVQRNGVVVRKSFQSVDDAVAFRKKTWADLVEEDFKKNPSSASKLEKNERNRLSEIRRREKNPEKVVAARVAHLARKDALGECVSCKRKRMPNCRRCERHWFIHVATQSMKSGDSVSAAEAIKEKLERQGFVCPYSGRKLVPGANASLDHIKPKSKHPELASDMENLEWVDVDVNYAKLDMSKEDFIKMCREVASY